MKPKKLCIISLLAVFTLSDDGREVIYTKVRI